MKYLIPIIILLLITQVSAQEILGRELSQLKNEYNNNLDNMPSIVKSLVGNERINAYLDTTNKQIIIGVVTKDARILELKLNGIEDPTLNIYVSENTIQKLENQEITIQQALDSGEIKLESQRIRTSIKLWFTKTTMGIVNWFKSIF